MVIKCPKCGNWTDDNSRFCPTCGCSLGKTIANNKKNDDAFGFNGDDRASSIFEKAGPSPDNGFSGNSAASSPSRESRQTSRQTGRRYRRSGNAAALLIIVIAAIAIIMAVVALISFRTASEYVSDLRNDLAYEPGEIHSVTYEREPDFFARGQAQPDFGEAELAFDRAALRQNGFDYLAGVGTLTPGIITESADYSLALTGMSLEPGCLKLDMELKALSDRTVTVDLYNLYVNRYVVDSYFSLTAGPGDTDLEALYIYADSLNEIGIVNIGEIALPMTIYDENSNTLYDKTPVLLTSLFDIMDDDPPEGGTVLAQNDQFRLEALALAPYSHYSKEDLVLSFYISNTSGRDLSLSMDNIYINGKKSEYMSLYEYIPDNGQAVAVMYLWEDDLAEAGADADTITSLTFDAVVADYYRYDDSMDLGTFTLNFS